MRFEPSGWTGDPRLGLATSLIDATVRWVGHEFLTEDEKLEINLTAAGGKETVTPVAVAEPESADQIIVPVANGSGNGTGVSTVGKSTVEATSDAPACDTCGFLMIRNGTCYKCLNCGSTTGCS